MYIITCCSLLPYSEPDQDLSPNNDPDWDWGTGGGGGGAAAATKQGDTAGADKENTDKAKHVGLTEAVLSDPNNVISEYLALTKDYIPWVGNHEENPSIIIFSPLVVCR